MPCFVTHDAKQTVALAKRLAAQLHGGELIAFTGGLGLGKTTFCQGLAQGLGVKDSVSSPTYTIANVYRGTPALAHFDAWRVEHEEDLQAAGFYDYLEQGAVVALEWSEKVAYLPPKTVIFVHFRPLENNTREICIEGACSL